MYFTQAVMADDVYMRMRVSACAAQQGVTDVGIHPDDWTRDWRKVWASSPGWDAAWESAMASGMTDIGLRSDVVTDGQILSQVQAMMPFRTIESHTPEANPLAMASREFVQQQFMPLNDTIWTIIQKLQEITGEQEFPIQQGLGEQRALPMTDSENP